MYLKLATAFNKLLPQSHRPNGPPSQLRAPHHHHRLLSALSQRAPGCPAPHIQAQASVPSPSLHQPHPQQVVLTSEAKQTTHTLIPSPLGQPTLVFPGLVASGLCLGCSQALVPFAPGEPNPAGGEGGGKEGGGTVASKARCTQGSRTKPLNLVALSDICCHMNSTKICPLPQPCSDSIILTSLGSSFPNHAGAC